VSWRDRLDDILLHPVWGFLALVVILFIFFQIVYGFGKLIEAPVLAIFMHQWSNSQLHCTSSLLGELAVGLIQGVAGGIAIVLPYLIPFLFGLSILEDIGYLPRIAS